LTWKLDEEVFDSTLVELLRGGDTVSPRVVVDEITCDLIALLRDYRREQAGEVETMLDRLTSLGSAFLRFDLPKLFDTFVRAAFNIYFSGFSEKGNRLTTSDGINSSELWLLVTTRMLAIGGYAVRLENWGAVRKLALQTFPEFPYSPSGETQYWLRHAQLQGENSNLLNFTGDDVKRGGEFITLALRLTEARHSLRWDLPQTDERLLNSLTQFDLLALLIAFADARGVNHVYAYPAMAPWGLNRAEPVLVKLFSDSRIQETIFAGPADEQLIANILREIWSYGSSLGSGGRGWRSSQVREFLNRHPENRQGSA
jgi:hypothetical protein